MTQSGMRLTLILALTLAGACGEDKPALEEEKTPASTDDDGNEPDDTSDEGNEPDDTSDEGNEPDNDGDEPAAPVARPTNPGGGGATMRDGGVPAAGNRDTGVGPAVGGDSGPASGGNGSAKDGGTEPTTVGDGECCDDGKCLCHGPVPKELTAEKGPYATKNYTVPEGCIYYPDSADAKPPFAAVAFSHGFIGTGGCDPNSFQGGGWAPLYASWGIVAMTINTGGGDQPNVRGQKLLRAIAAFKAENMKSGSPLMGKLAGRYGTSGFSMGGGGTSLATVTDKTLLTSVAVMPWGTARSGIQTPTLVICGSSDGTAPCSSHGNPLYRGIMDSVPKMRVTVQSGHQGQPSVNMGKSGKYGLAFQKVFLEGDTRWRPLLVAASSDETNIK